MTYDSSLFGMLRTACCTLVYSSSGPTERVFFGHPASASFPGFWHFLRLYDGDDAGAEDTETARTASTKIQSVLVKDMMESQARCGVSQEGFSVTVASL